MGFAGQKIVSFSTYPPNVQDLQGEGGGVGMWGGRGVYKITSI